MGEYNTISELLAFVVVAGVAIAGSVGLIPNRWPAMLRRLVVLAVVTHIVGSVLRMSLMLTWYGRGDFLRYFDAGWEQGRALRSFDVGPLLSAGQRWGTAFVERVSAVVLFVIGPSLRAEFVVFSLFATVGLVLITVSALRALPGADSKRLTAFVLFWPSLVFWPSSVGKEALILLASGLVVYGWWGTGSRVRWVPLIFGLTLALFIRPHIAMMIAVALGLADWLTPLRKMNAARVVRGVALLIAAFVVAASALEQLGIEANEEALRQYIHDRSGRTAQGGSKMATVDGPLAVPLAFVNVLGRPLLWEAHNALAVLSSVEVIVFWGLMWRRREDVWVMMQRWRHNRLLLLIVPLTAVLIFFYGAFVSNMGILARQRVVVLPLLFVLAEAAPAFRSQAHLVRRWRRAPGARIGGRVPRPV